MTTVSTRLAVGVAFMGICGGAIGACSGDSPSGSASKDGGQDSTTTTTDGSLDDTSIQEAAPQGQALDAVGDDAGQDATATSEGGSERGQDASVLDGAGSDAMGAAEASDGATADGTLDSALDSRDADRMDSTANDAADASVFTCGTSPYTTLQPQLDVLSAQPSSMNLTSSLCVPGTSVAVPMGTVTTNCTGWCGVGTIAVGGVAQYLTVTAVDSSTFPSLSFEFIPTGAITARGGLPLFSFAKNFGALPGSFGVGSGKAWIFIGIGKDRALAAPCNADDGVTLSLAGASGTAHQADAVVYYGDGGSGWTTTGPTLLNKASVAIVLTPTAGSSPEYVQIQGTKSGCTVDTGVDAAGSLRASGLTGRIPIVPNAVTISFVKVAL